ncbi:AfsR/SARP family transcriptional regulator [Saccharomonospora glauca]|uniref:DNA-binding transcriptional activator of the SARP family n=1 Tax=Saccharomonospora glauca K62 TaxID=928724 RepID=I1CWR0_9PSEU|nr:BTAD domain-containing putative transcriptional regulator [Saccharomonospora glauca]EIE97134.1 DNA-binding transcriptional activator of the SARP family [Saccharomonospora glauca K62]
MTGVSKSSTAPLVSVLGPLRISRRGAEQPVTDKAMRVVASALVADANRGVSTDTLVDLVWAPHERPTNPLDALETRITKLRTLLTPEADLTWTAGGCVLTIEPELIDAVCFERMIEAARWCTPHGAISTLEHALSLWRGDPLPDLCRDGVDHPESVRLRQLRARAIEDLAVYELEVGSVEDAAGRLLALLSAEPLRERACGHAMWALHRLGMTDDAVTCYDQLVERLEDELGEGPSTELRETYRSVTGREPPSPNTAATSRVDTTFLGRTHELARLSTMMHRDRFVTVTGPAGSGKTRLALEALSTTEVPATFVRLSTCDSRELHGTVAAALGVHARGLDDTTDDLPTVLAEYLCGRRHVLVLDGCEHLLTSVRALVRKLRSRCRDVTVVVTSRVRLGLAGEQVLPLGPLARDGVRDPLLSRAGNLFRDRARRVKTDYPRDEREAEAARTALRHTACLPLALEVLAGHVVADDWTMPATWPTDLVEWSCSRLTPAQRELLGALTVFGADAPTDAVRRVVDADGTVDDTLAQLTRAGLLGTTEDARHRLPDLVRRHATQWFTGTEAEHKARQRHALWCVDAITDAVAHLPTDDLASFERLRRMEDDVCAALRWAVREEPALAAELTGLVGALTVYRPVPKLLPWQLAVARAVDPRLSRHAPAAASGADAALRCGLPEEGLRLAARAAELASTPRQHWAAVHTLVCAYYDLGDDDRAATVCHELLALPDLPDQHKADAHAFLSLVAARGGHHPEALRNAELATRFAHESGSARRVALAAYAEGLATRLTDLGKGAHLLARARAKAKTAEATWITASAGTALADALLTLGRVPEAAKLLQLTLDDWHRMRAPRPLRACVDVGLRCVAFASGRSAAAALARAQAERSTSENLALARTARAVAKSLASTFGAAHP